jgi:lycopene cyclase domain-containing protein
MTYFGFLLRFLILPILVLLGLTYWDNKSKKSVRGFQNGRGVWIGIGVHVLLAVMYTTPWDNYLVATQVWYYNPKLVTGLAIGYVPIEEYTFFVLETILAGLWWCFLVRRFPLAPGSSLNRLPVYLSSCILASLWLIFAYLFFLGATKWTYLSIILFWALPPMFIQLLFGADILWHYRKVVFWGIMVPATYLSLTDIVALKETTWSISTSQTTGILFFGILPLEEVIFFFVTNVLITFGMTLLLANVSQVRFAAIKKPLREWKQKRVLGPRPPSR